MPKLWGDIMEINKGEIKVKGVGSKYQKAIVLIIVLIFLTILFMILLLALRGYNSNLGAQSFQRNYILVNVAKSAFNKTLAELYLNPSYSGENFSPLNNVNVSIMVTPIPNTNVRGLRNVSITVSRGNNRVSLKSVVKVWEWRLNDFLFFATDSINVGVNNNAGFFGTDDPNIMPKVVSLNTLNWDVDKQNTSVQAKNLDLLNIIKNKALSLIWAKSITGSGSADAVIYSNSLSSTIRNKVNNNNDKIISNTPPPDYLKNYIDPFPADFYSGKSPQGIGDGILSPNVVYISDNSKTIYLTRPGNYYLSGNFSKTGNSLVFQVRLPKSGESTYNDYEKVRDYVLHTIANNRINAKFDYFGNIYTDPASAPSYAQPIFIKANNSDMGSGNSGTTDVLNPDFYFRTSFDIVGDNVTNFRFLGNEPGVNLYINGSFSVGGNVTVNNIDTDGRTNNTNNNILLSKPGAFRIYASNQAGTSSGTPVVNAILCAPDLVFNGNPTLYGAGWTSDPIDGDVQVNGNSSQFKYDTSLMTSASFSNADFLPKVLHIVISNQR
jgi:hypothetical protein